MPLRSHTSLNSRTIRSRSAGVASIGTRSLSWRLTPHAPTSASIRTASHGDSTGRTTSPKGSRPRLHTVHRPKENLCSGRGVKASDMGSSVGYERGLRVQRAQRGVEPAEGCVAFVHHTNGVWLGSRGDCRTDKTVGRFVDIAPHSRADPG